MKTSLIEYIENALKDLGFPTDEVSVQIPKISTHGDLTTNYALLHSKKIGQNPIDVSEAIKNKLTSNDSNNFFEEI